MAKKNVNSSNTPVSSAQATSDKQVRDGFPVVGIGSSAGGLDALQKFFKKNPPKNDVAYVVVSHLDPNQVSMLPELLQRCTKMKVLSVVDGTKVRSNHVYVLPSNNDLSIVNRTLHLHLRAEEKVPRLPIDDFFTSLARDLGNYAIGIVLSGTASDGTVGVGEIKSYGGTTFVQEPSSAKYDGMPKSAIASHAVDYILSPEEMPAKLSKIINLLQLGEIPETDSCMSKLLPGIPNICTFIKKKTKHDFFQYKKTTLCRRIERRMNVLQIDDVFTYIKYLEENEKEIDLLVKELLIRVTHFFRDKMAFDALKQSLCSALKDKPENYVVRAWVAGCSTGEEAYSVAILLAECVDDLKKNFDFQVFGTDIDVEAIEMARKGTFSESIADDVSPERLSLFFHKENKKYRVKKDIRNKMVFAVHNVISDPPFTKLDLISCRNVFIYLEAGLQAKILPIFHFSLMNNGLLFMGTSESIGPHNDLFSTEDKKWRIFVRKDVSIQKFPVRFPLGSAQRKSSIDLNAKEIKPNQMKMNDVLEKHFVKEYVPPTVIINSKKSIVFVHGKIAKYFKQDTKKVTGKNILDIACESLRTHLNSAIIKSEFQHKRVTIPAIHVKEGIKRISFNLKVTPFTLDDSNEEFFIITFEERDEKEDKTKSKASRKPTTKGDKVEQLEHEVQILKENLQSSDEELQTTHEEHLSSTEELQSMNEELQSANEELETTKEEQQSMNEELITTNAELESKLSELSHLNDDMKNLLNSTEIATLFLDIHQNIRGFTPKVTKIIKLINTDIGRPISDIVTNLEYKDLLKDAESVLSTLAEKQKKVRSTDNKYYLIRILPYRTSENVIDGVVINFFDITQQTKAEMIIEKAHNYAEQILTAIKEPIVLMNEDLRVILANKPFYSMFNLSEKETIGKNLPEIGDGQWKKKSLSKLLKDIALGKSSKKDNHIPLAFGDTHLIMDARKITSILTDINLEEKNSEIDNNHLLITFYFAEKNRSKGGKP